jgi:HAD superfamily hydrolase (TIGR01509 family)
VPLRALVVDDAGVLSATREQLTDVVRQVRAAGLATAVLSNADGRPRPALVDLVDLVVLCGSDALRKPDPAVFRAVAQRLGVAPGECVFVDDLAVNVRGAVAAGMAGVVHRDLATTTEELRVLLGLPLR